MGAPVLMEPSSARSERRGPLEQRLISVIVPVVERTDDLVELYRAFAAELDSRGESYEFLFVFDGGFTPPPELSALSQQPCRFVDCRHGGEAGCAMGADWPRQLMYRQCLAEVEAKAPGRRMGPPRETALREASSRRRRLHLRGEVTPPDLED